MRALTGGSGVPPGLVAVGGQADRLTASKGETRSTGFPLGISPSQSSGAKAPSVVSLGGISHGGQCRFVRTPQHAPLSEGGVG